MSTGVVERSGVSAARPTVSVVVPAHNRAGTIAAAIESVLGQSLADLEIIVVDDGSNDETGSIAREIAREEPRLRVLSHPSNRGAQAARNTGIRAAQGEWIAFLDSDDVYYPDSLEIRLTEARNAGLSVVHSDCDAIGSEGPMPSPIRPLQGDVYRDLLIGPGPAFPGMIVKKDLLNRIGLLDESVRSYQEWDTAIRLAALVPFGFVDKPTFLYDRRTLGAISQDDLRTAIGYEKVVSKHWREVLKVAGPRALAQHYRAVAGMRGEAGDRRGALRCAFLAQLIWPLSPRRNLRVVRQIVRTGKARGPRR